MYSKYLTESEFEKYTVLAPNDRNTIASDQKNVIRCWNVGGGDLSDLLQVILDEKIGTVLIQFNYGFFDFSKLSDFIHKLVVYGRDVSITLHSTTDPIGYENKKLIFIKNALSICSNVFVHSSNDIFNLNQIDVSANVSIFPQGVYEPGDDSLNLKNSNDAFVVASYGFYLPHKGFHELIDAIYILREEGVNVHLLMLNAMYDAPVSRELIESAKFKIAQYGLADKVSIVSDFLSEDLTIRIMRNADLVIFPYQETGESSSAAVRMGLASGVPVAVTPLPIFDDVNGVVFKLPGTSPDKLALGIKLIRDEIKNSSVFSNEVICRASHWKRDRGYKVLGRKLLSMLRNEFRYLGSDSRLGTQVGQRVGQTMVSTGKAGCLVFGPYISLDVGLYRFTIRGCNSAIGLSDVRMDVAIDKGKKILGEVALANSVECEIIGDLQLSLTSPCSGLEVRVWVDEGADVKLSLIQIIPLHGEEINLTKGGQVPFVTTASKLCASEQIENNSVELSNVISNNPVKKELCQSSMQNSKPIEESKIKSRRKK